jgi:hypothetical protein
MRMAPVYTSPKARRLLTLYARASSDGFDLGLVRGNPTVQRVFEVTGTTDLLPFTDTWGLGTRAV